MSRRIFPLFLVALFVFASFNNKAAAQFLTSPQPGDIYKEFVKVLSGGNTWRVTHSATTRPEAQVYLPNTVNSISIADLSDAIRAEIVIDRWGGHIGTVGHKFKFNNNAFINIPQLGAGSGIPAGTLGECYMNQFNPVVPIPLNNLIPGNNTFQGDCSNQTCFGFNWGQFAWMGVIVRVYYNSSKPHPTGSITSPTNNSAIGENPTIAATTSGSVAQVDFLAYYDGIDYDGDGVFQEYHHSYHRGKTETVFVIKNHVGTDNSSPYQSTWATTMVPNQGGIKLKALIKGTDGTFFVTNEVTGLTLERSGTVVFCKPTNVPQSFWRRNNQAEKTSNFVIPAGTNLANATSAKLVVATWNGIDGQAEAGQSHYMKVNNYTLPNFGADHHYSFDAVTVPINQLVVGTNTFKVFSQSIHHGIEIMWPGPGLILTLSTGGAPVGPSISQHPADQTVPVGQTATFAVQATGSPTLTYQWQKDNSNISGATNSTYTTPLAVIGDNGSTYRCVVTNPYGNATSNSATLTVGNVAPNVTTHPANQSVIVGATATFSVTATGTAPLSYQWQKNTVNIPGATNSTYTTPPTTLADNGSIFRCIVSNIVGPVNSNNATLTVTDTPPPSANVISNPGFEAGTSPWSFYTNGDGSFASVPGGVLAPNAGNAGKITIVAEGSNVQLYQSGLTLEANMSYTMTFDAFCSSGNDMTLNLQRHEAPYTTYGLNNYLVSLTTGWQNYSVQFTTTGFTGTVSNGRLRFWFAPFDASGDMYWLDNIVLAKTGSAATPPTITTHPANQSVIVGATATFSVTATGTAPLSYQWQKNTVNIPGATNSTYTTPPTTLADNGSIFRCIVSNIVGPVNSNNATLTVTDTPPPSANVISNPGFEAGTSPWSFYTNGDGSFASVPGGVLAPNAGNAGKITIVAEGSNVQLYQSGLTLEANMSYTMTFDAFCSSGNDMTLNLQRHEAPYTTYGLNNYLVSLTTGWQNYSVQFTTTGFTGTVSNGRLRFWFAPFDASGDMYWLDNIVLAKTTAGPVAPTILQQPANRIVTVGQSALFSVVAIGTPPLNYQWERNGVPIPGAISATYNTPATTPSDSGAQFRCVVSNATPPAATSNSALLTVNAVSTGNWWNNSWDHRLPITVDVLAFQRIDKPAEIQINFTTLLALLGVTNPFDDSSIRVIEVNIDGTVILDQNVASQFDRDATYNASSNALGNLILIMPGTTAINTKRYYHVYFNAPVTPLENPVLPPQVSYVDNVNYEGQLSYQIITPSATYYYHKQGGGFASMIDNNANDWISYHPTGGSAGSFRGIPNLGDVFHPGYTNSTSSILSSGPIKLRVRSLSTDGNWEVVWSIYPTYAHMTLLRKGANYWFLYEGTPGGTLDTTTDFMYRSNGLRNPLRTSWFAELAAPEWVYFGDRNIKRSLFLAHHEDDAQPDYYRQMENNMTVFGYGRQEPCCTRYMSAIPQNFTIGFAEDTAFTPVSAAIRSSYEPLNVTPGVAETRPVPFAVAHGPSQEIASEIPTVYALSQNYPNPFNPSTAIRFDLPEAGFISLKLYDVLGREVRTLAEGVYNAGRFEITLNATDLASGIYMYRITANQYSSMRRLVLLK